MSNNFLIELTLNGRAFNMENGKKSQEVESECSANDQSGCSAPLSAISQMLVTGVCNTLNFLW